MGIPVAVGQTPENLEDAVVVVYSSAVKPGNAEFDAARARKLPLVRRAEMLAEIMRLKNCVAVAGTNGKTTTTTLVAALLDAGGLDPTVVNGGIINAYGTNARLGAGEWVVVEADESDGTFLRLPATVAVVTNIDPDHLDYYGTFERCATRSSASSRTCRSTASRCCASIIPKCRRWSAASRTAASSPMASVRRPMCAPTNVASREGASHFDVDLHRSPQGRRERLDGVSLPMPGEHNVQNSLAAIAVARELGIDADTIETALERFGGVKRRFTRVGEWNGAADHRRLCAQSVQDRRGAQGGAAGLFRSHHRDRAAPSLYAPARHVRAILHLR